MLLEVIRILSKLKKFINVQNRQVSRKQGLFKWKVKAQKTFCLQLKNRKVNAIKYSLIRQAILYYVESEKTEKTEIIIYIVSARSILAKS